MIEVEFDKLPENCNAVTKTFTKRTSLPPEIITNEYVAGLLNQKKKIYK
jgi:hypothetical protein